jgi:hypothetical protein
MLRVRIIAMFYAHDLNRHMVQLRNLSAPHGENPYVVIDAGTFMKRLNDELPYEELTTKMLFGTDDFTNGNFIVLEKTA